MTHHPSTLQDETEPQDPDHFTRFWPATPGQAAEAPLFLMLVAPARALALALLWVTSSPGRAVLGLLAVVAVTAVVLLLV